MPQIKKITKLTDNRFLNLYHLDAKNRVGGQVNYYVASRAKSIAGMKLSTRQNPPDGVAVYALWGDRRDKVLLIRQYRYSIDDYIYEFPAGLVDEGEDWRSAAVREIHEETGFTLHPLQTDEMYMRPYFTTIGMSDESVAMVYGYVDGESSLAYLEDDEELEVVLADRAEVRRILKEERVAVQCAYMLMHFLADEDPFAFLEVKL
ncbi:MAG: NUDIX hydrolase [Eubacteriales bacterium]|nr:NUDIX hydrolase [Eubacteriales bacterium]